MTGPTVEYWVGHVLDELKKIPDESVQMVVTSPPYWALRTYAGEQETVWPDGWKGGFGLEPTPEMYVEHTVMVLREIRRVLRKDGTVWWDIGDCYNGSGGAGGDYNKGGLREGQPKYDGRKVSTLKPKDLCMIPFRVALAAQADGWWVRSDIIWHRPNPMPESVQDRPAKAHEYIFLLTKSKDYYYDANAVREKTKSTYVWQSQPYKEGDMTIHHKTSSSKKLNEESNRSLRSVWTMNSQSFPGAHYATFPAELPRRCILAGTSERGACPKCGAPWERVLEPTEDYAKNLGGEGFAEKDWTKTGFGATKAENYPACSASYRTIGWQPTCKCGIAETVPCIVLDPFSGSGTTLEVAKNLGRSAIGIDISKDYEKLADERVDLKTKPLDWFCGEESK